MDNYEILEQIGKGSFGIIQKIKRKSDGKILAWKEINYGKMSEREQQQLVAEVSIVQELRHPNVVRFYDKIINTKETKIYIVMEYCEGGDLSALLKKRKKDKNYLSEDDIWKMFSQVLLGINECHNFPKGKILHRDLKPANIFIDGDGNMKLGDFGLSRLMGDNSVFATTHVGTPYYMSPEQVLESNYDEKSDIWSAGCLLYEMCALRPPFEATNHLSLAIKIKDGKFERIPMKFSEDLQKLVEQMMHSNPDYRPSVQKLLGLRGVSVFIKEGKYAEDKKLVAEKESCLKKKEELFKEQRVKAYIKEKEISALENILYELENEFKQLQVQEELSKAKQHQISKQQIITFQQLHQAQQNQQSCNYRSNTDVELNKQTLNTFVKELMIRNNESSNSASKNSTTASSNGTFEYLRKDKETNFVNGNQSEMQCVQPFQNTCEEFLSPRIPTARQTNQQFNQTLLSQQLYLSPNSNTNINNKQNISSYYKSNPNTCASPAQQQQQQYQQSQVYTQHIANLGTAIKMAQQSPFARGSSASNKQAQQRTPLNSNLTQQSNSPQVYTSRPRIISEIGSESNKQIQQSSNKTSSIFTNKQHLRTSTSIDLTSQQTNLEAKYFLPLKVAQTNRDHNTTQPNLVLQSQTNTSCDYYNDIQQQQQPNNYNIQKQILGKNQITNTTNTSQSNQLRRSDSQTDNISRVTSIKDNTMYQVVLQNIPPKPNMKQQLMKPQQEDKCKPNYQQNNSSFTTLTTNTSNKNCNNNVLAKPPKLGQQQQSVIQEISPQSQIPAQTSAAYINNFNYTEFNKPIVPKKRSNNSMGAGGFATFVPVTQKQNTINNFNVNGNNTARTNTFNSGNSTERGNVEQRTEIPSRPRNSSSNGSYQQIPKFYTTQQKVMGSQVSGQIQ